MVGTWKGTAIAVQIGANPHRDNSDRARPSFSSATLEFTFDITEQQGNRFAGSVLSGTRNETVIGGHLPGNTSGVILDENGRYGFVLRDRNTADLCYSHGNPSSLVVGCYTIRRN
jgi:hypothetical protein